MTEPVKVRPYNSPRRRAQAAETRGAVLAAAGRQFEAHGYAATTVATIAADAEVSVKTIYLAFETKAGVLRALWNKRLRGDAGDIPVAARDWYHAVLDEPDPVEKLRLNASNSRAAKFRLGGILEVVRSGAGSDTDVAALWERIQSEFHANQRAIVESLAERNALASGLSVDRATDILWTLNHPTVWLLLSRERGWTAEDYEQWLADASCTQLLGPGHKAR
jgi:AcrR family transcriptional regulator